MKSLDWKETYEIGIKSVDEQHKHFLELINRLSAEIEAAKSIDDMVYILEELYAYANFHFISEENTMRKISYPNLKEHRMKHDYLKDQLNSKEWVMKFVQSEKYINEFVDFLSDWFLHHTVEEDKLIAEHLDRQ